jgi:alpha-1,6-mannosyltransferase
VDLCVSPGSLETFGLSAIEAFASGTPVLSADEGGVAENIGLSGAGRMFVSRNADSLAEEATALLAADRAELGARGRAYAEAHHGWDLVFDRLFEIYRGVLAA